MLFWLLPILFKDPLQFFVILAVLFIPILISITIHEWSHGIVAYKFGDPTPKMQGRLSFNPFAHLDPIGTLMLFIVGIGWAKPVEINLRNIPNKTDQMLVALAGPASNFILAILFTFIAYWLTRTGHPIMTTAEGGFWGLIALLVTILIRINIILGLFNLLPIPPLDGSNVIKWFLPERLSEIYSRLAPYGMLILILLLFTVGFGFIFETATKIQKIMFHAVEYLLNPLF